MVSKLMIDRKQSRLSNMEQWKLWKEKGELSAKQSLIEKYIPLVDYVSSRLATGLPKNISRDDLYSYGIMGLMDAVEKFDHQRGLQFETYALSIQNRADLFDVVATVFDAKQCQHQAIRAVITGPLSTM